MVNAIMSQFKPDQFGEYGWHCVSLQIAIMKVLASYPYERASFAAMKADLVILAGAGAAWNNRLKRLAARLPDLDIFTQGYVVRIDEEWKLTVAGREVLLAIEAQTIDPALPAAASKLEIVAASNTLAAN